MDIQDKIDAEMNEMAEKLAKAAPKGIDEYKACTASLKKGEKPCGVCKACKSMKKAEDKPIGDKSDQESDEEKARKEKNRKKAQNPKSKEKNVDASNDAARAGATDSYQEKVNSREVKKGDEKPDENGSTDEYDKEADPKKPYEPVKKPKIKLPDSAMKRKVKERAMKKSETAEMIQQILDSARAMGKEEFKKSVAGLSPEQQILVSKILTKAKKVKKSEGETDMKKATEFDDVAAPKPENEEDLPQEEVKDGNQYEWGDREDKKVIKENTASVNHQGDISPEGRDGHEISDPKPQRDWESWAEKYDSKEDQNPHAGNLDKYAKIRKSLEENMKEQLTEIFKSEEATEKFVEKALEKGVSKDAFVAKLTEAGFEEMAKACGDMIEAKMKKKAKKDDEKEESDKPEMKKSEEVEKSDDTQTEEKVEKALVWNNWQADALGASVKRGRNAHYNVQDALIKSEEERSERLAKGEFLNEPQGEKLEKGEGEAKTDLNDIIEKGFDRTRDQIEGAARLSAHKPYGSSLSKSFEDTDMVKSLGLSAEEAAEILGESKKTEE